MDYLWISLGSALGGSLRHWLSGWIGSRLGTLFPWGTLAVNFTGCLLIGFLAAWDVPEGRFVLPAAARKLLMVGLLGGYTTFSAFGLQTLQLAQKGAWSAAAANVLASVALCLFAVWLGHSAGHSLNR
jgi:CrcB protein